MMNERLSAHRPVNKSNAYDKRPQTPQRFFYFSIVVHIFLLAIFIFGFDLTQPLPVLENTNKMDVISAVVLGDTEKSKLLIPPQARMQPQKQSVKPIVTEPPKPIAKSEPVEQVKPTPQVDPKQDVIALKLKADKAKAEKEKKLAEKQKLQKMREQIANDLLADMKVVNDKHKKMIKDKLKSDFTKTLKESAEKSLRQQLLNEEIKLKSTESRQSQGEVNKYKALILQAISEHWIVPPQVNKKLYSELMIHLSAGGTVLDVQITKSSGDPALDSSVRAAVFKASPLPVPSNRDDFEAFRQFSLRVKPENIIDNG